jgi:hypothetical protein
MVTMLLTTLGSALACITIAETLISANYRSARETFYAADAGIERAMTDLRLLGDWSAALVPPAGNATSTFDDGAGAPRAPDGATLDLARLTTRRQAESDVRYGGSGPNSPSWRLFAHASLSRLVPAGSALSLAYVIVWVADDPAELDGDSSRDSNGVLLLRAEAFGTAGAWRAVEATVARPSPAASGSIRVAAWRQVR